MTAHHLTPRAKTRRKHQEPGPTIMICWACHRQLHSLFTHAQLAHDLNTLDDLRNEPRMQTFLAWARKQDPQKHIRVRNRRR